MFDDQADIGAPPPAPPAAPPPAPPTDDVRPASWDDIVTGMAKKYGVDPRLALAVAKTESSMNPNAVSSAGARGFMQLMPETAARHGVNPDDPADNIRGGIEELRDLLAAHNNDVVMALRRYNGSPQAPDSATDPYVQKVLAQLRPSGPPTPRPAPMAIPKGFDEQHPWLAKVSDMITDAPIPAGTPWPEVLERKAGASVSKFAQEATTSLNPVNIAKGIYGLVTTDPRETLRNLYEAHKRVWEEGQALNASGSPVAGHLRQAEASVPLFGPRLADADKFAREGEYARSAGALTDVAGQVVGPKFMEDSRVVPRVFKPRLNPAQAKAVDFGLQTNVPIDVATASGSPFALKLQRTVEATPSGSPVAERVALGRGQTMPVVGEELARDVHPVPVMPEQAGTAMRSGVEDYIGARHAEANTAYDALRQAEAAAPVQQVRVGTTNAWTPQGTLQTVPVMGPMQLPADLTAAKAALRPIADRFDQLIGAAQQDASPGLRAIKQILDGPDFMPASQLDQNLSVIKGIGRGADLPTLRSVSQGLAAKAVEALEPAHDAAIAGVPGAQQAVLDGRIATTTKYVAQDILDKLSDEPVESFNRAVRGKDTSIVHLRELKRVAPKEIPKIARAVLEDLFSSGTAEGGWKGATGLEARWARLGPATKDLLFGPTAPDLDKFFLLGKMLERTPNASGTALTLSGVGSLTAAIMRPSVGIPSLIASGWIAKLMNSRAGVRLLTKGYTIPASGAKAIAWSVALANALHKVGAIDQVATPPPRPQLGAQPPPTPPR